MCDGDVKTLALASGFSHILDGLEGIDWGRTKTRRRLPSQLLPLLPSVLVAPRSALFPILPSPPGRRFPLGSFEVSLFFAAAARRAGNGGSKRPAVGRSTRAPRSGP